MVTFDHEVCNKLQLLISFKSSKKPEIIMKLYLIREDTRQKEELERGHRIIGVIGNHMDVLRGQWNWQSKRLFKLPSLTYDDVLDYSER